VQAVCLPIAQIDAEYNRTQTALANNTLYKVMILPTDLSE
jgi:hypothetical protein